jgi:ribonuclease PH
VRDWLALTGALTLQHVAAVQAISIVAASLALANAAIEMRDLVAACIIVCFAPLVVCNRGNTLICIASTATTKTKLDGAEQPNVVDPTYQEEQSREGSLLVAYMPALNEITQLVQLGTLSHRTLNEVCVCVGVCVCVCMCVCVCVSAARQVVAWQWQRSAQHGWQLVAG